MVGSDDCIVHEWFLVRKKVAIDSLFRYLLLDPNQVQPTFDLILLKQRNVDSITTCLRKLPHSYTMYVLYIVPCMYDFWLGEGKIPGSQLSPKCLLQKWNLTKLIRPTIFWKGLILMQKCKIPVKKGGKRSDKWKSWHISRVGVSRPPGFIGSDVSVGVSSVRRVGFR